MVSISSSDALSSPRTKPTIRRARADRIRQRDAPATPTTGGTHGFDNYPSHDARGRRVDARARRIAAGACARQDQAALQLRLHRAGPARRGYKNFAAAIKDSYDFEPYWGNTLFKQGTELVALQRGNLEMCNLAPADISKQIPAVVADDVRVPVSRRRSPEEDLQERRRPRVHQDGARPARHPGDHAGVLRLAQRQPEARQARSARRPTSPASSCACRPASTGSSSASRSASTRRPSRTPRSTPRCRRAPSTARTIRWC